MKFQKTKYDRLDGSVCVKYTFGEESPNGVIIGSGFCLEASPQGVFFGQLMLESQEDLRVFAEAIASAWNDHESLKTKIVLATPEELAQMELPLA